VISTAQASNKAMAAKAEVAALKYIHDKNMAKSKSTKNAGWKGKIRDSSLARSRSRKHQKRAEIYTTDQAVWDAARHVVTQAKYHRYLEGPGHEYEVPRWMMTPLYHAVQEYLIAQNPDGDKREMTETAYNKVYLEVGDKKIVEEPRKKSVQRFRDFAVRYDDQEPWPEAEKPEMLVEVVEPTPIPATTEVRTETTTATEMATQTVTVQRFQTVTVCQTETVTDRKTQSVVMCKTKTVTKKKTQTMTVEAPQSTTFHPVPTTALYFHKGPGKIAAADDPATLSQKIDNVSKSINNLTFTSKVKDDGKKGRPTPYAGFRFRNHHGKFANGTTPATLRPHNSTKEETKSKQSPVVHQNSTTIQDTNTSTQTSQNESKSEADPEEAKLVSLLNKLAKGLNETASFISEKISKWSSNHH
jgi:hypothetical protein